MIHKDFDPKNCRTNNHRVVNQGHAVWDFLETINEGTQWFCHDCQVMWMIVEKSTDVRDKIPFDVYMRTKEAITRSMVACGDLEPHYMEQEALLNLRYLFD
jgi:hypothetical protein